MDAAQSRLRQSMSAKQLTRFDKCFSEPIYVISQEISDSSAVIEFKVSGSTRQVYTVAVTASTGKVSCSCMDVINCRKAKCHCKHVCFVIFRVMRLSSEYFYDTLVLSPSDVSVLIDKVLSNDFDRMALASKRKQDRNTGDVDFSVIKRVPTEDDECPICYNVFFNKPAVGCPDCGNGIHTACAIKWLELAKTKTCVYCRSEVWSLFRKPQELTI